MFTSPGMTIFPEQSMRLDMLAPSVLIRFPISAIDPPSIKICCPSRIGRCFSNVTTRAFSQRIAMRLYTRYGYLGTKLFRLH